MSTGASCRHPRSPCPGLVLQLRPGRHKLALERLNAPATTPQLASYAPPGDPGGSGSDDEARKQQQQNEKVQWQVDQKR
jgi:hypothetical protein